MSIGNRSITPKNACVTGCGGPSWRSANGARPPCVGNAWRPVCHNVTGVIFFMGCLYAVCRERHNQVPTTHGVWWTYEPLGNGAETSLIAPVPFVLAVRFSALAAVFRLWISAALPCPLANWARMASIFVARA